MVRLTTPRRRRVRAKLTSAAKAVQRQKRIALSNAVQTARDDLDKSIDAIQQNHQRSSRWARLQVSTGRVRRRKPTAWNGFVRARMQVLNKDRPEGKRIQLTEFMRTHKDTLREAFLKLTPEQREALRCDITVVRDGRIRTIRLNRKAVAKNVYAIFKTMEDQWRTFCADFGIEGFFIATRSSIEDTWNPRLFYTPKAEDFCRRVLEREPEALALQLESWSVSGISSNVLKKKTRGQCQTESRKIIQDELNVILRTNDLTSKKVPMNYKNYERKIVEEYGVALKNWPFPKVKNPGEYGGRTQARELLEALANGKCHWILLTPEEVVARKAANKVRHVKYRDVYVDRKKVVRRKKGSPARSESPSDSPRASPAPEHDTDVEEDAGDSGGD
ncbi:hypothetical protein BDN72DRAFT_944532 [Pluteus cervinus]|uniref:Uncharacterized protein n=1 Tax=Pluteus cervinus TaxID=181527 RepID=A0ACD3A1E2_9AGAR|nr:hypothetical protein BDN72DRAFT_944532 [Pluteus cervinus]